MEVIKITFNDLPHDSNHLKVIWIDIKKEHMVLIKKCSWEYKKNFQYQPRNITMDLIWKNIYLILHWIYRVRKINDNNSGWWFCGEFCCGNMWFEGWEPFFYKQLPLNDNKNNFHENFNDKNYKITVSKLHDYGWVNSYFTS